MTKTKQAVTASSAIGSPSCSDCWFLSTVAKSRASSQQCLACGMLQDQQCLLEDRDDDVAGIPAHWSIYCVTL